MKKVLKALGIILMVLILGGAVAWFGFLRPEPPPISAEDRRAIELMPLPSSLELKGGKHYLSPIPKASYQGVSTERLDRAYERFSSRLASKMAASSTASSTPDEVETDAFEMRIRCDSVSSQYPGLEEDESYRLKIDGKGIELSAPEERGIFHGLESLFQLLEKDEQGWYLPGLVLVVLPAPEQKIAAGIALGHTLNCREGLSVSAAEDLSRRRCQPLELIFQ